MTYTKENRGAIWAVEKKESDNHPDFTGNLNIDGVEYNVSAWRRKPDAAPRSPALNFAVKRRDLVHEEGIRQVNQELAQPQRPQEAPQQAPIQDDDLDSIPF